MATRYWPTLKATLIGARRRRLWPTIVPDATAAVRTPGCGSPGPAISRIRPTVQSASVRERYKISVRWRSGSGKSLKSMIPTESPTKLQVSALDQWMISGVRRASAAIPATMTVTIKARTRPGRRLTGRQLQVLAPQEFAPQPFAPHPFAPQPLAPQEFAPQPMPPHELAPHPLALHEVPPQAFAPHELASQPTQGRPSTSISPVTSSGTPSPFRSA